MMLSLRGHLENGCDSSLRKRVLSGIEVFDTTLKLLSEILYLEGIWKMAATVLSNIDTYKQKAVDNGRRGWQ